MNEIKILLDQSAILSGELADKYPEKQMHALTSDQLMRLIELVEEAQIGLCTEQFPVTYKPPATVNVDEDSVKAVMNAKRVSQQLTE